MAAPRPTNAASDRTYLREDQYRDERNLEARRAIYAYTVEGGDIFGPTVDSIGSARSVLDVGCGPGMWHGVLADRRPGVSWCGLDLSEGMAASCARARRTPVGVADAVSLPVADHCVDAALALHMLYHLPVDEQPAALAELARVVRPGGRVVLTTNASDHLAELDQLLVDAGRDAGADLPRLGFRLSFLLDGGDELVASAFGDVRVVDVRGRLAVTEAAVVAGYVGSLASIPELGADARSTESMDAIVAAAERRAATAIERHGAFEVTTHAGVLVADV